MKIYYMRDNHTFLPLPFNVDEAIRLIKEEFEKGYTYGMLCSKDPNIYSMVHANGKERLNQFLVEATAWLNNAIHVQDQRR